MSIEHIVWSLDEKKPLSGAELKDEKELETLIVNNVEILNDSWLVLGNQVRTDAGKYIDILCMDYDGDLVVIELKKDMTPREVTAQVMDYAASISLLASSDISRIYDDYSNDSKTLNEAYREKFGSNLNEELVNQNVKMIIVAAQMDPGTERIIQFLRNTYQVDINILFFQVFQCDDQRLISRVWFQEDVEEVTPPNSSTKRAWNKEYYVSFGVFKEGRDWEDAVKYGFISAGHGKWYSHSLGMLSPGNRVWVNIPQNGYVGVGIVKGTKEKAKDAIFTINGKDIAMRDLPLNGEYFDNEEDDDLAEYIVKVEWIKTVPEEKAVKELGFFGNQNSVCKPRNEKWEFTIERLKKYWKVEEK